VTTADAYAGFEPRVGEIRALRTFRIGPGGVLYPLFSDTAWSAGQQTARCRAADSADPDDAHGAPDPDCTCGLYAYATAAVADEYAQARHVLAVVACCGRIIAGTRGIRAEYARVEALWMSSAVPLDLAADVAASNPSAVIYADREAMLDEHAPTRLDCYEPDPLRRRAGKAWLRVAAVLAVALGVVPTGWLGGDFAARTVWAVELAAIVIALPVLRGRQSDVASKRRTLLLFAIAIWVAAPFAGTAETLLLRLPLVLTGALALLERELNRLAAGRFPARVSTPGGES
jgi:hypothetical protein